MLVFISGDFHKFSTPCRSNSLQSLLFQIVYFYESNSCGTIHTTDDRGVATWWQGCDNSRIHAVSWNMAAVPYVLDLIAGDNPAKYSGHPVIVRGNQSSSGIVQL